MRIGAIKNPTFTVMFKHTRAKNAQPALYLIVASGMNSVNTNANSKHPSKHTSLKD